MHSAWNTDGADDVDDVFGSVYDGADVTTQRLVLRMRTHQTHNYHQRLKLKSLDIYTPPLTGKS